VRRRLGSEFRVLWAAAAVSNLGDGLRVAALPLLAATITRDPAQIAAVTAAIWLPWLLIGLYAGALVDRADRPALIRNVNSLDSWSERHWAPLSWFTGRRCRSSTPRRS
jgi:MFS family permease